MQGRRGEGEGGGEVEGCLKAAPGVGGWQGEDLNDFVGAGRDVRV